MKTLAKVTAALVLLVGSSAYAGCEFEIHVTPDDLYSSKGAKLQTAGQIIRQAVANAEEGVCGLSDANKRASLQKAIDNTKQNKDVVRGVKQGNENIFVEWDGKKAYLSFAEVSPYAN
ncbi:MAG: hypothetical protein Q4C68_02665 [Moraxella sp.]|nr:hypothetical protein [Moraxella sp.]